MSKKPTYEELEQRIKKLEQESVFFKGVEALAEKTNRLDNILRNAQDIAIATTDLDFRINYYNPMAEKLFGYSAEEILGKTVQEMHTKEKVPTDRFERAIEQVRLNGEYRYLLEQKTDNGKKYIDSCVSNIFDQAGELAGYTLFSLDVTKQKQAEDALRESERLLSELVESSPAAIYKCEASGDFAATYISHNVTKQTGYTANNFMGNPSFWADHIHPDDKMRVFTGLELLFETDQHEHEYRFLHRPSQPRHETGLGSRL